MKNVKKNVKVNITKRFVEALKPVPGRASVIFYDKTEKGFGVCVTAKGVISFVLNYSFRRRERRITIGRWPSLKAGPARKKAEGLRVKVDDGIDPLTVRRQENNVPTLTELAERYMTEHVLEHNGKSQRRNSRAMLDSFVLPRLGKRLLNSIDLGDISALHNWVNSGRHEGGKKKTPYVANRVHSLLRSMFNKAIDWGLYVGRNPARAAKKDGTDGVVRFVEEERQGWQTQLSEEQFAALDRAIDEYATRDIGRELTKCERDSGEAIRLLILNGSRLMQIVAAPWGEFDLKRRLWLRPRLRNKGKKPERIVLSEATVLVLKRMKERAIGPWLFPGRSGPEKPRTTIRRPWVAICRMAGLAEEYTVVGKRGKPLKRYRPLLHIHDLRHSYASWLVNHGTPLEQVGKLLGQLDPNSTRRYAHLADETLRTAANSFGDASSKWVQ